MKLLERLIQVAGAAACAITVASPAAAGTCTTLLRSATSDTIIMSCKKNSAMESSAVAVVTRNVSAVTLTIDYQTGPTGGSAKIIGMNSSGQALPNCTFTDTNLTGGSASGRCDAAATWKAVITFQE
jgi:hypothetical protein